jgi:hypothetical protein
VAPGLGNRPKKGKNRLVIRRTADDGNGVPGPDQDLSDRDPAVREPAMRPMRVLLRDAATARA